MTKCHPVALKDTRYKAVAISHCLLSCLLFSVERDVWVRPKPIWAGPWQLYCPGQVCTQGQLDEVSFNSVHLTFKLWFVAVAYRALISEWIDARISFIYFFSQHARAVIQLINRFVLDVLCLKKFKKSKTYQLLQFLNHVSYKNIPS